MKGITKQEHFKKEKTIKNMLKRLEESEHNTKELQQLEETIATQYEEYQKLLAKLSICIYNYKESCAALNRVYRQSMRSPIKVTEKDFRETHKKQESCKEVLLRVV